MTPAGRGVADPPPGGPPELPPGLELVRVTDELDERTVPAGLLRAHRVAPGVWGRLVVRTGRLHFAFEDAPDEASVVAAGEHRVIPPGRPHHLELTGPVRFVVEFHRPVRPSDDGPSGGTVPA